MAIYGAILGDIIGSKYEEERCKDNNNVELVTSDCMFTDDTVTSISIKYAIDNNINFEDALKIVCRQYPRCGFATMFENWVFSDNMQPYGSWGNGSAMRVSYIGEHYEDYMEMQSKAKESALITHNSEEGVKGAVVTATCIWMAKHGKSKDNIYNYVLSEYPSDKYKLSIERSVKELQQEYIWDVSCAGSISVAMRCFYESTSYESFIRNVLSLDCDAGTICCIGGGVAEEYYKEIHYDKYIINLFLDSYLIELLNK